MYIHDTVCNVQVIDMNQDNTLSEALKMPNLLSEFVRHAEVSGVVRALDSLASPHATAERSQCVLITVHQCCFFFQQMYLFKSTRKVVLCCIRNDIYRIKVS